jgi:hypothetical protein
MEDSNVLDLMEATQRLETLAASMEAAAARIAQMQAEQTVGRITATVEEQSSLREQELEERLAAAEAQIARLSAHAPVAVLTGRKTLSPGTATMLAKQGVSVEAGGVVLEAAALDGALASLSIEQRIAVKAELLRSGLIG